MSATRLVAAVRARVAGDARIHAWQIRGTRRSGFQTYLVQSALETSRRTAGETLEVTVFVRNRDLLGRATVTLGPGDEPDLARRVDEAVYMAGLGGDSPWTLPTAAALPRVEAFDAALAGDRARATSRDVVEAWRAAIAGEAGVKPMTMELFCGEEWTHLENSAGLAADASSTRVSLLTLVLAQGGTAAERYSWDERRRVADLDVAAVVGKAAAEARDLTRATVPPTGEYPVVIDADEIPALLGPVRVNASAEGLYQKASRFEVGKALPIEGDGEPLTLISNAIAPYALTSYAFDGNGVAGQRVEIIRDNVFVRPWASKQYADYLGTQPTGGFANWELPPGKMPLAELREGGERVLFVRSFSWLTPDAGRGNFGSEIRVGYLHEKGQTTPVKGGTVSGNVFSALGTAHYAREAAFRGDYLGPAAVRFENLGVRGA